MWRFLQKRNTLPGIQTPDDLSHSLPTTRRSFYKLRLVLARRYTLNLNNSTLMPVVVIFHQEYEIEGLKQMTLTVRFLLGSNFFEYHKVLMRYFGCYVHVLRFDRHEICFPMLDLVQAVHSLKLTKCSAWHYISAHVACRFQWHGRGNKHKYSNHHALE